MPAITLQANSLSRASWLIVKKAYHARLCHHVPNAEAEKEIDVECYRTKDDASLVTFGCITGHAKAHEGRHQEWVQQAEGTTAKGTTTPQ